MAKPARADDSLTLLLDIQRQMSELTARAKRTRTAAEKRRGKQIRYAPNVAELPGPQPTEMDIARAKRLWRRIR
jgi:hypothetical protein